MAGKTGEYRYKLTVSKTKKVNLGNYESEDYFESMTEGYDNKADEIEVRQRLISAVSESIDGQIENRMAFKTADQMNSTVVLQEGTMLKPEGTPEQDEVISEELWPKQIVCRECNCLVDRKDSKYPGNPFFYKCKCGKMNYSKGYKPKGK